MSTPPGIPAAANRLERDQDLVIYSHSPLFYWWPVWAVGFIMALLTLADGGRMAIVPDGTKADRALHVEAVPPGWRRGFETMPARWVAAGSEPGAQP